MVPSRSVAQRIATRMPIDTSSGLPTSSACSIGVSAPSSRTSTQAKGRSSGWPSNGWSFHDQDSTVPTWPTSTISARSAEVTGSYSCGGTSTRPSWARTPSTFPARSPPRNAPSTGPVDRVYGKCRVWGACSVASAIVVSPWIMSVQPAPGCGRVARCLAGARYTSAESRPSQYGSRRTRLTSLPVSVRGNSPWKSMDRGTL
jgi:hypothetical protein